MYEIKLPKVLILALSVAKHYRKSFFNTSDLARLANQYSSHLVRTRSDKKDYKYEEDTRFGGLRGNLSTLLTWRGLVKKGNTISGYFSIGRDDRILNAVSKGEVVLSLENKTAHTNNLRLKELLETEAWLYNVRESQAHITEYIKRNPSIGLVRDMASFPKESVVISKNGQCFIRAIVNNFVDSKNKILEFSILNLWDGTKFKKTNIHPIIVIPTKDDSWSEVYALKNEDIYNTKPLTLYVDIENLVCTDKSGNTYELHKLDEAFETFSKKEENIQNRLNYNWAEVRKHECEEEAEQKQVKENEFSVFLSKFLNWDKTFTIDGKDVVDMNVSGSGGPDVRLKYSGGTVQNLELEHDWKNYLEHGHQNSNAWAGSWIFAEEEWDKNKIIKLFSEQKKLNGARIPDVFLCLERGQRKAYRADWSNNTFNEIPLSFPE